MWSTEDDVLLEAATYYKENKINYKETAALSPKYFIDPPEFELADDDSYYEKYGKIFATTNRLLVFHCSYCKKNYGTLFNFLQHISAKHLNEQIETVIAEKKQEKENDSEETSSQAADSWSEYEPVFEEGISDIDEDIKHDISEKTSVQSIKKKTWNDETNPFTRTRTINSITSNPIKRNVKNEMTPEPMSKRNSINKVTSDISPWGAIERSVESSQEESLTQKEFDVKTEKKSTSLLKKFKPVTKPVHKCDICNKVFIKKKSLSVHGLSHSDVKEHECKVCGKFVKYKDNLKKHMQRHTDEKNYSCMLCDKRFFTSTEAKIHERTHTGERPYVCYLCGDTFKTTGHLSAHVRRHKDILLYKCEVCGKRFLEPHHLKKHMNIHSKERRFPCTHCSSKFLSKNYLKQHLKLHINAKEYSCDICGKSYNLQSALASHKISKHTLKRKQINQYV